MGDYNGQRTGTLTKGCDDKINIVLRRTGTVLINLDEQSGVLGVFFYLFFFLFYFFLYLFYFILLLFFFLLFFFL